MKNRIIKRLVAFLCVVALVFCDSGSVLAESSSNADVIAAEDGEIELPDDELTNPDDGITEPDNGTTEPDDGITEPDDEIIDVPEHEHVFDEMITKEPTYSEVGEKTYTCECGETYAEEIPMLKLKSPKISNVENVLEGSILSWNAVEGAEYYKVFCNRKSVGWVEIAQVYAPETSYLDEEVEVDVLYEYYIISCSGTNESVEKNTILSRYLERPVITFEVTDQYYEMTWQQIEHADFYYVYRSIDGGEWQLCHDTIETTFRDEKFVVGEKHAYSVRAVCDGDEYTSYSPHSEEMIVYWDKLPTPKSFKASSANYSKVKLSWDWVATAEGFQIYRSTSGKTGTFKKIATVNKTNYTDTGLKTNQKYYYKIRTYRKDGVSDFTIVKSVTPKVIKPVMKTTASATSNSIKVSWEQSTGAHGYYVYRKRSSGEWKKIATIKDPETTSYKDKGITGRYTYSVRAYRKIDGKTYSSNRANSIQASVLGQVTLTSVKQKGSGRTITVKWEKVKNATGYQVYKKTGKNGSWKLAKTTGSDTTSYSTEIPQGTYTYWKVRAIRKIDGVTTRASFSDSKSYVFATPKFNFEVSDNWGQSVKTIKLTIENTSSGTLRFYSEEAMIIDEYDESNDRYLYLANSSGEKLNYSDVAKGKTKTFIYKVDGSSTGFYSDSILSFMFKYDGLKYLFLTYADGSYYELYILE